MHWPLLVTFGASRSPRAVGGDTDIDKGGPARGAGGRQSCESIFKLNEQACIPASCNGPALVILMPEWPKSEYEEVSNVPDVLGLAGPRADFRVRRNIC